MCYTAKFDPFLSLDFSIWQPCTLRPWWSRSGPGQTCETSSSALSHSWSCPWPGRPGLLFSDFKAIALLVCHLLIFGQSLTRWKIWCQHHLLALSNAIWLVDQCGQTLTRWKIRPQHISWWIKQPADLLAWFMLLKVRDSFNQELISVLVPG